MSLRKVFFRSAIRINSRAKGFTLIELLVSISVMAIVFGITISGGPQAIARMSLSQNTYEAELLLREVQLEGSSIRSMNNSFGGAGLFFTRASSSQTLKFVDRAIVNPARAISIGDGLYSTTTVSVDEKVSILKTTNRNVIGKLCVATTAPSIFYCNNDNPPTIPIIYTLTVSFSRPKQTAHIYVNNSTTTDYAAACIEFDSPKAPAIGFVKSLFVYKSGMITKKIGTCK